MARIPIQDGRTERLEIRCSPEERQAWEEAAGGYRGRPLSDWVREALGRAAAAEKTRARRNRQG